MKKIVLIFSFLVAFVYANAQNQAVDRILNYTQTFLEYTGGVSDTIGVNDTVWTYTINKYNDDQVSCEYYLDIDSVSGSGAVNIFLEGKLFTDQNYTRLDTVVWTMTADTVISVKEPAGDYQYWRVKIQTDVDTRKAEVQKLNFKFLK